MAFGAGRKENERYCWNCLAILPTKQHFKVESGIHTYDVRICTKCSEEIKPPEEKIDD
jgi:RNase P subunit RPR2